MKSALFLAAVRGRPGRSWRCRRRQARDGARRLDLARARIVDLSHPFDGDTLYWPTATSGFELSALHRGPTPGGFFYSANSFCAPEHGGTHLDAPSTSPRDGRAADEIPLERLIAPGGR